MISRIRQQSRGVVAMTVATLIAFIWVFCGPAEVIAATVKVPAGTVVRVRTNSTLSPESLNAGDNVYFTVVSDVSVDGNVVVKAGAQAVGEVSTSQKKGALGKPAKIGVKVKSVQAVDESTIFLSGNKQVEGEDKQTSTIIITLVLCLLAALIQGGDADIPVGTEIDCTVAGTAEVNT